MRGTDGVAGGDGTGRVTIDFLKGAIAGAIGVWAMDRVDWYMYNRVNPDARRRTKRARPEGKDPAHVMAGRAAAMFDTHVPQPHAAGIATHYGLGIVPGALYGAFRDRVGGLGAGRGAAYGLGLFLLHDELLNPALGLAAGPTRYPWQAHARGLVSHLVYGVVTNAALDLLNGLGGRHEPSRHQAIVRETISYETVSYEAVSHAPTGRETAGNDTGVSAGVRGIARGHSVPGEPLAGSDLVDEASEESFPASDPPSYMGNDRVGGPDRSAR